MNINDFATEDMRSVVEKIMRVMEETPEPASPSPILVKSQQKFQQKSTLSNIIISETLRKQIANIKSDSPSISTVLSASQKTSVGNQSPLTTPGSKTLREKPKFSSKFNETYARMQAYQVRRDQILKKNIDKNEEQINKIHTHNPILNKKSQNLIRNTSPMHIRYKEIILNKEKKINELVDKAKIAKEEELKKELTFQPKITERNKSVRSTEEYYNYMKSWKELVEKTDIREREIKLESELDGVTFKPKINRKSEIIAKNFPCFEERVEKGIQIKENKLIHKRSLSPFSFKPEMQARYKKQLDLGPVFDRLYTPRGRGLNISPTFKTK